MKKNKTFTLFKGILSLSVLVIVTSCSTYQHSFRVSEIEEENIVVSNKVAVDLKVDLNKPCQGKSGRHKTVKDAKDEAYYDAIISNEVHILVDPIYSITTTKTLFGQKSSAEVFGFAGYYRNARSFKAIEDALKAEQIEKDKASFQAAVKNYKSLAAVGGITSTTEVEKYRVDENCKPCTISKEESKSKSTDEFFKFVSRLKY